VKVRSWNKKIFSGLQDLDLKLQHEIEQRKNLEQQKIECEAAMEEMKKTVRAEVDARIQVEEEVRKTEREIQKIKKLSVKL